MPTDKKTERRIHALIIPAGMTSYMQTLNHIISKPFKDHMRMKVNEYIQHREKEISAENLSYPNSK